MRCPTLSELPPPPSGRTGWPWTEECPTLPETMTDGTPWPIVSIVTPSYNQGAFIEETIRSVLLQGYPRLQYVIMDGGSSDESADIIRKYARWLVDWVSEPDNGQVHAIDKGWKRTTGDVIAYLNSDDTYLRGALPQAVQALHRHPSAAAVCGGELRIDSVGRVFSRYQVRSATLMDLLHFQFLPQPATFLRRQAYEQAGGLDLTFGLVFDFELWTRLVQIAEIRCVPLVWATTRWYPETRTLSERPAVIAGLERVAAQVLSSPAGERISTRERKRIRAELSRVLLSVYLDDVSRHILHILPTSWKTVVLWPPIALKVGRLLVSATAHSLVALARRWKNRLLGPRFGWKRLHWSDWTPDGGR